jgi:hypothetical protein
MSCDIQLYCSLYFSGVNESGVNAHLKDAQSAKRRRPKILVHPDTKDIDIEKNNMTKLILGLGSAAVFFITICVVIAAIVKIDRGVVC